jgi:hypothetical protein
VNLLFGLGARRSISSALSLPKLEESDPPSEDDDDDDGRFTPSSSK